MVSPQQFLSTVLSQRGPAALPYEEDVKLHIRQHLISLADAYPSLHPKVSSFTHNDGRTVNLLHAEGTFPIVYRSAVYNLPAVIWLLEPYPRSPPAVFLSPTRDMVVKSQHPHVDRSGSVSVPYLRSWLFPSSNLVDLVRHLSQLFGQDPPLYTSQSTSPTPNPSRPTLTPSHPSPSPSPSRVYSSLSPYGERVPPSPQAQPRPAAEDSAEAFRCNSINKILETVHGDLYGLRKTREVEMESLFATQAELRSREKELSRGLREMQEVKEGLEQQLQLVLTNADTLEGWVRENEVKAKKIRDVNVDDVFEPLDALSRQLVECTAVDMAIEDVIYSLDKVVQEGAVPFEMYLKSIRVLSRDQFFHRALGNKVRATQLQAQVANMAARVPQYPS